MKNLMKNLSVLGLVLTVAFGGSFLRQAQSSSVITSMVITGSIITYAGPTCPAGYLSANGTSLLRAGRYANLFSALGTSWGTADGTHFNIPDLRGRFLRGVDGGAARDPDRASRTASATGGATGDAVGTVQVDQYVSHSHGLTQSPHSHGITDPGHVHSYIYRTSNLGPGGSPGGGDTDRGLDTNTNNTASATTGVTVNSASITISVNNAGGNETRPTNADVTYCIAF